LFIARNRTEVPKHVNGMPQPLHHRPIYAHPCNMPLIVPVPCEWTLPEKVVGTLVSDRIYHIRSGTLNQRSTLSTCHSMLSGQETKSGNCLERKPGYEPIFMSISKACQSSVSSVCQRSWPFRAQRRFPCRRYVAKLCTPWNPSWVATVMATVLSL
jgi:hypothetical protein